MKKLFTAFTLLLLLSTTTYSAEKLEGKPADKVIRGAAMIWYKTDVETPSYIRFNESIQLNKSEIISWLKAEFESTQQLSYRLLKSYNSQTGIVHETYGLSYQDYPLEFMRLNVHSRNGIVLSISGHIAPELEILNSPSIQSADALDRALAEIGSDKFKWENNAEESWLKEKTGNPNATYYPVAEQVIVSKGADYKSLNLRYAFKFDVRSSEPFGREEIYVDAQSGEILFRHNLIHAADSLGTAHTGFSGIRGIVTKRKGTQYSLQEDGRNIRTWSVQNTNSAANRIQYFDSDNLWLYSNGNLDMYALDAHWGAEMAYDFFHSSFGRRGIDDDGYELNVYTRFGEVVESAFWDGESIYVGDGKFNPYSTIDIIGHEWTHGLIDYTADLIGNGESGALDEAYSDIFGNCIEYYGKPNYFSWRIGEDRGTFLRDMEAPKLGNQPDTYGGTYWYTGSDNDEEIHTNSGVLNYWFKLLVDGGNGINDNNDSYEVKGIEMQKAAWIAYETLTAYLLPTSDYEDMYFYSVIATLDSFKRCDVQHAAVVNAWYAVGFGNEFVDHAVASFNADKTEFCNAPFTVSFTNLSVNALSYTWDFGDGAISTLERPSHTYNKVGEYKVSLSVVGGDLCGTDQITRHGFINALSLEQPQPELRELRIDKGNTAELKATSVKGSTYWYANEQATEVLHIGNTYTTPELYEDATYFVKSVVDGNVSNVGADIDMSLAKGQFSDASVSLAFDVFQSLELQSVTVNAKNAGPRTFVIINPDGSTLFTKTFDLEEGIQSIDLRVNIPLSKGYKLKVTGDDIGLWRSNNAEYPYSIPGVLTITGNSLGSEVIYPYFYAWKVKEEDCTSGSESITVSINELNPNPDNSPYNFYVNEDDQFTYYVQFYFDRDTEVKFGLYGINGQLMSEVNRKFAPQDPTPLNVTELFGLQYKPSGVYFISIQGGVLEKTEKIVNKGGSN